MKVALFYSKKSKSERPSLEPPRGAWMVKSDEEQGFKSSLLGNQDPAQSSASTEIKESKSADSEPAAGDY